MKKHGTWYVPTINAGKYVGEKAKMTVYFPEIVRPKAERLGPQIQRPSAGPTRPGSRWRSAPTWASGRTATTRSSCTWSRRATPAAAVLHQRRSVRGPRRWCGRTRPARSRDRRRRGRGARQCDTRSTRQVSFATASRARGRIVVDLAHIETTRPVPGLTRPACALRQVEAAVSVPLSGRSSAAAVTQTKSPQRGCWSSGVTARPQSSRRFSTCCARRSGRGPAGPRCVAGSWRPVADRHRGPHGCRNACALARDTHRCPTRPSTRSGSRQCTLPRPRKRRSCRSRADA